MDNKITIYQTKDDQTTIEVMFENDTVWLNRSHLSSLFERDIKTIGKHISNVFNEGELERDSVVAKFATTASDGKTYQMEYYNLDVIISVGYRVKSQRGTQFRQWATQRLKDYLLQGYAINQKRLEEKKQEVKLLKTGIRILNRAIEEKIDDSNQEVFKVFSKGLELLDDYDQENLDAKGTTKLATVYPTIDEYLELIERMYSEFSTGLFAQAKDNSFESSINQIRQTFSGKELYPTLEEKASNLLYLITKNHSFIDGNKRIAAACFLYFLSKNNMLYNEGEKIISNEALAALTLFIASSKVEESETVKKLIISILNRNQE